MMKNNQYKTYLRTVMAGALMCLVIAVLKGIFASGTVKEVIHVLSDSFFIAGFLIMGTGILIFSANEGTFHMLGYGVREAISVIRPKRTLETRQTYYEYKQDKDKHKKPFLYLIVVGVAFIVVAGIFLAIYYSI